MTYRKLHVRSGLTAIAAVLALSSTPLLAQELTTPPDPATETPSEPAPAVDPLAPEREAAEIPPPEVAPPETAAPAMTSRAPARARTPATDRAPSEPVRTAAPVAATPATEPSTEPMPVPPPSGVMVPPGAMPVDEAAASETTAQPVDEMLPIAGAAGLGLLALGGIGMAVGRRRQRKEELAHQRANREYLATHPDTSDSHAPGPALKDVPRTKLPPNFDLSRFGPHVRAAYLGPTEDNPSLSMKHRLRRAAAMDQQARLEG